MLASNSSATKVQGETSSLILLYEGYYWKCLMMQVRGDIHHVE